MKTLSLYVSILLCSSAVSFDECYMSAPLEINSEEFQREFCLSLSYYEELKKNVQENIDSPAFQEESDMNQRDLTTINAQIAQHIRFLQKAGKILNATEGDGKTPVAFSASRSLSVSNNVIKYDSVDINIRDVYDKESGRFTAPVPGLYRFYTRTKCRINLNAYPCSIGIYKNNVSWRSEKIANEGDEIYCTMELKANDTVHVRVAEGLVEGTPSDKYTLFQGYRLM